MKVKCLVKLLPFGSTQIYKRNKLKINQHIGNFGNVLQTLWFLNFSIKKKWGKKSVHKYKTLIRFNSIIVL